MATNDCKDCVDSCTDGACTLGGKPDANGGGGAPGCLFGIVALVGVASLLCAIGCSTANSAQPAKSQTQNNTFDDCVIVVATKCSISNRVIRADGTKDVPAVELFTMAQSQESSGTESFSPTSTQTPTTDVKPDLNVHYNDAMKNATDASKNVLSSIVEGGRDAVLALMAAKMSGTVKVQKTDGTDAVVECKDGQCSFCTDGACELQTAK